MAETATLTFTLDPALRDRFLAAADAALRAPDDVLGALALQFVEERASADLAAIERAVREADDPSVVRVTHDEAATRLRQQRSEMAARIGVRRAG